MRQAYFSISSVHIMYLPSTPAVPRSPGRVMPTQSSRLTVAPPPGPALRLQQWRTQHQHRSLLFKFLEDDW